ncbi:MAG: aspartate/glutamate racemase family protein [Ideonella sp.]
MADQAARARTRLRLLLINPNTSVHITERLVASARLAMAPGDELTAITATQGPAVVRSADDLRAADANSIDLAARHAPGHDGIVLGISLDGAAGRLRSLHPRLPVVGMTEAALLAACLSHRSIGLLTLGPNLLPLYRQRVEQVCLTARVIAYEAPEMDQAFEPARAGVDTAVLAALVQAGERLITHGAQSIVLAGAVLCGYAEAIEVACRVPVFDGVTCAVRQVREQLNTRIWSYLHAG